MTMRYLKNVTTIRQDRALCTDCGICLEVCPRAVFVLRQNSVLLLDPDACIECGACALNCPAGALSVDSGVACAAAMIRGALTGKEASCGCADDGKKSGGCC